MYQDNHEDMCFCTKTDVWIVENTYCVNYYNKCFYIFLFKISWMIYSCFLSVSRDILYCATYSFLSYDIFSHLQAIYTILIASLSVLIFCTSEEFLILSIIFIEHLMIGHSSFFSNLTFSYTFLFIISRSLFSQTTSFLTDFQNVLGLTFIVVQSSWAVTPFSQL